MDFAGRPLICCLSLLLAPGAACAGENAAPAAIEGSDGWRFLPSDKAFSDKLMAPDLAAQVTPALNVISDFQTQLQAEDIALLVVPVPPKIVMAPDAAGVSAADAAAMRAGWEKILAELRARGVTVLDLAADFSAAPADFYCRRDTHWSGRGIERAAEGIGAWLAGSTALGAAATPAGAWQKQEIKGDLGGDPEAVDLWFAAGPFAPDQRAHPLVLLGDSHVLVFHSGGDLHTVGAGLPDRLGAALGSSPDVLGVRGSGATSSRIALARRARADDAYLDAKQAVVWCFAGREFTESDGWKKVPLRKPGGG
jgi:alginate O-acetyltransferase complex protein AlgJ